MKIEITLTDEHFDALSAGVPNGDVAAYLSQQIATGIAPQFVKAADDRRFAAVGLPNLKYSGLDEEQCAILIANASPKHAARMAAKAAEEAAAKSVAEASAKP